MRTILSCKVGKPTRVLERAYIEARAPEQLFSCARNNTHNHLMTFPFGIQPGAKQRETGYAIYIQLTNNNIWPY